MHSKEELRQGAIKYSTRSDRIATFEEKPSASEEEGVSAEQFIDRAIEFEARNDDIGPCEFLKTIGLIKTKADQKSIPCRFSHWRTAATPEWQAKAKKARQNGSIPNDDAEKGYSKRLFNCALRIYDRKQERTEAKAPKKKRLTIVESSDSEEEEATETKTPKKKRLTGIEARILESQAKSQEKDPASEQTLMTLSEVGASMTSMANVLSQAQSHFDKVSKLLVKERKARKKLSKETKTLEEQLEEASESLEEERSRSLRLLQENKRLRDELSRRPDNGGSLQDQSKANKRLKRANQQLKRELKTAMDLYEESTKKPKVVDTTTLDVQTALDQARLAVQQQEQQEEQESMKTDLEREKDCPMNGLWF